MEYRFAALVVNILVVISMTLGITIPIASSTEVRSLLFKAMAVIAPQIRSMLLPPISPVRLAPMASFVFLT